MRTQEGGREGGEGTRGECGEEKEKVVVEGKGRGIEVRIPG